MPVSQHQTQADAEGNHDVEAAAEREALLRDGYVVIPQVLDCAILNEVRACIEDSRKGVGSISAEHRYNDRYQGDHMYVGWSDADREREGDIQDECFVKLITSHGMLNALARCGITAPTFQSCSVMSKPAGAPALYWCVLGCGASVYCHVIVTPSLLSAQAPRLGLLGPRKHSRPSHESVCVHLPLRDYEKKWLLAGTGKVTPAAHGVARCTSWRSTPACASWRWRLEDRRSTTGLAVV